jgi:hypothetical protein
VSASALGGSKQAPPAAPRETPDQLERYAAILKHAELELELAGRGDVDGVASIAARWQELTSGLPERPPAAAASLLERALLMHERTHIELIRVREALLSELATSGRAKRAANGYGAELASRRRLDRSA